MSSEFYREIRHLSFGNQSLNKEQLISIKNILKRDLANLYINSISFDVKKYISEIMIIELENFEKIKEYRFREDDIRSKIITKFKIIRKNLLIIYTDFLIKENLFTFKYTLDFFNRMGSLIEYFCREKTIENDKFLEIISNWNILQNSLLAFESSKFKCQLKTTIKEIRIFLIFLCYEYEKIEKNIFKLFKFLIIFINKNNQNNNNLFSDNYKLEEFPKLLTQNELVILLNNNFDIEYFIINKYFTFFSNENHFSIKLDENIFILISDFLIIFKKYKSLDGLKEQIKAILNVLNSSLSFENNQHVNLEHLGGVNQYLANEITILWIKNLDIFKSIEFNYFVFGILIQVLFEFN